MPTAIWTCAWRVWTTRVRRPCGGTKGAASSRPGPRWRIKSSRLAFGDVDNDGDVDLWLGRAGPDRVLLNDGKGNFSPADFAALAGPDELTHVARLVDMDSDGDLDYLAFG